MAVLVRPAYCLQRPQLRARCEYAAVVEDRTKDFQHSGVHEPPVCVEGGGGAWKIMAKLVISCSTKAFAENNQVLFMKIR